RDFTQRVQFLSPEEVNKFQNKFFGPIIDCINRNDGLINQLMGDGLMATFTSIDNEMHEEKAYQAACEILQKIEDMNAQSEDDIKIGIGVHSGEIIAGNIGTEERRQFSISVIPVITAARLEQMTKDYDCSFLVSMDFYNKIKHISKNGSSLGMVKLKGLDQHMELIKLA
ncbi:MAG: adenylate/guanylate cyclase domain-containing protein, partial [Bacteroidota bacterium]